MGGRRQRCEFCKSGGCVQSLPLLLKLLLLSLPQSLAMVPRAPQRGMGPPIPPVTCARGLLGLALTTRNRRRHLKKTVLNCSNAYPYATEPKKSQPNAGAYNRPIRFFFWCFFSRRFVVCRFCTSWRFFGYSAMKNQFHFLYEFKG